MKLIVALILLSCLVNANMANAKMPSAGRRTGAIKSTRAGRKPLQPQEFISMRAQKILSELRSRPLRPVFQTGRVTNVIANASKNSWLEAVYGSNMVDVSWAGEMLSDKRLMAEVLERELGAKAQAYYPKTIGLREFLVKRKFLGSKGEIKVDGDELDEALQDEFPGGFIVRPAVGLAPQETAHGLFANAEGFVNELLKPENVLFSPAHMKFPVKSHLLGTIASGEAVVLQENIVVSADAKHPLKTRSYQTVRVHTYEGRVVEGAVPERWVQANFLSKEQVHRAEAFVGEFLMSLPMTLLTRQAWGVEVAVMDNGEMRITDILTNRGGKIAWSSYLDQPRVIAAYSRHFEENYGLHFNGLSGTLIRHGFANYLSFWEKRIEKSKPGLSRALAYLPPAP